MIKEEEMREKVNIAYTALAKKRQNWPNKYDISVQLSKMLCDYTLLSKVNLIEKKVWCYFEFYVENIENVGKKEIIIFFIFLNM